MDEKNSEQVNSFLAALGCVGEMAHQVYAAMISAGADRQEAIAGMTAWIAAFWHETSEDGRRKQAKGRDGDE